MQTIKLLFQLCFFRGNIAMLPFSPSWLMAFVFINFVIQLRPVWDEQFELPVGRYVFALMCSYAVLLGCVYLFLKLRKQQLRFMKMLLAYLGTETLLMTVFFTLILYIAAISGSPIWYILLIGWSFALKAYIIKQTLETPSSIGVMLAINLEVIRFIPFLVIFYSILTQEAGGM